MICNYLRGFDPNNVEYCATQKIHQSQESNDPKGHTCTVNLVWGTYWPLLLYTGCITSYNLTWVQMGGSCNWLEPDVGKMPRLDQP